MSAVNIIRAWKDEEYRDSLTAAQRATLPQHPAGTIELQESEAGEFANPHNSRGHWCTATCSR